MAWVIWGTFGKVLYSSERAWDVERQQAGPGGLNQIEGCQLRLQAQGVPESEPVGYGFGRLDDRLETLARLVEHEGRRLADAQR